MPDRDVVVITGGSAGVGRATAREFARSGYDVGLIARDPGRLAETVTELTELGARAVAISADVADAQAVEDAADRFELELGPIDVWVNNAMTSVFAPVADLPPADLRRVTDVTYHGTVHGTMAALRRMRSRNRGTIVQVGSALAYRSIPLQAAYCAAKHAVVGFSDSLRSELLHDESKVRLTVVDLPGLNTPQFGWARNRLPRRAKPVPPIYQPEVAARAIVRAAHEAPRDVRVGWPTIASVLGQKLAPALMDRYLARSAWDGQMAPERNDPARPDNLWRPVPGRQAAHGSFDGEAKALGDSPSPLTRAAFVSLGVAAIAVSAAIASRLGHGLNGFRIPGL